MTDRVALITGSNGLFGRSLSLYLLNQGVKVIGIDDLSGSYSQDLIRNSNFQFFKLDILDSRKLEKLFKKYKPNIVYHFAAYAAEGLSPFIRKFNYENNVVASMSIINLCIKYEVHIVFTSSIAVYGNGQAPYLETDTVRPIDPYGIAKYAVELDILSAASQFGLKYTILRPHNVVGEHQNIWDRYRNVLGIFARQLVIGKSLSVFGDGTQVRAYSDIDFILPILHNLIYEQNSDVYNIGSDKTMSINEILDIYKKLSTKYKLSFDIDYLDSRHEVHSAFCEHAKIKKALDFIDKTDLEPVIEKLIKKALIDPNRKVQKMPYEITEGIYASWKE